MAPNFNGMAEDKLGAVQMSGTPKRYAFEHLASMTMTAICTKPLMNDAW
jgi:hypothetical protein